MQKISASTTTANAAGEFTEGNPSAGVDATQIKAAWLNTIQRELGNILVAGGMSMDPDKDDQIVQAIKLIIANVSATESATGVARIATQQQVIEGANDASFITPKKLRAGFSMSLATNGFVAFPSYLGGLIVQWGTVIGVGQATNASGVAGPTRTVTLPATFPNEIFAALASMRFNTMTTGSAFTPGVIPLSNSQISVQNNYTNSPGDITWFAIGR